MIGTLGKKLSSGIFYSVIAKYSGILINLLIGIILARLLSPEEFGIVALVMVFINFFNILSDLGIGPAIIQNKKITNMDVKSIFSVSLLLSLFLGGVFFSLSSVVASFYEKPQLSHITQLLALSVVFFTVKIVPLALHRKKQQFKTIGLVTLIVQSVSGLLAILLAYFGFSYYSLIAKSIFDGFFTFIILFLLNPITPGRVTKSSINKIAKFSIYQFMFNCTSYFSRNSDNLLIGKFIGTVELGFYNRAYQLMMLPIQNLTHVISPVLHPVLSEYQDDEDKIRLTYFKLVKLLALIGFPLSIFLFFSSEEIILILYGDKWAGTIEVFRVLSLTIGFQILLSSTGAIFQSTNRTDLLFISGLISASFMVGAITYGVFAIGTLSGICFSLLIAILINFIQGFYVLIKLALKSSLWFFFKVLALPGLFTAYTFISLLLVNFMRISNLYLSLVMNTIFASLVFIALLYMNRSHFNFIGKIIKRR